MGELDSTYMTRAIELAKRGWYTTKPNPRVGCVIVAGDKIVGEGWHERAGEAHAEIVALDMAGDKAAGATAYVSLEPCCHQGRTPPCTNRLIEAGIKRLVYAIKDPNVSAGGGEKKLRSAGVEVEGPLLEAAARQLNMGFFHRCETGLPRVTMKIAASLDGRTAMANGESQWITGPPARQDVQRLRAQNGAVITGIGTVLQDDPAMTVRAEQLGLADAETIAELQPLRVIVDSKFRIREDLKILWGPGEALVVTALNNVAALTNGTEVISLPNPQGKVSLSALLRELANRQCNDVLVEAGANLAGAFVEEGLVDELIIYMAPKLMGSKARAMMSLNFDNMADALELDIVDVRALGNDWRVNAQIVGQK
jgi:diaminohydroxyphosphoribosylaminopyrimidine deaminase/5-amino-6-(5-phosphoribosylamino)uracil reductase